MIEKYWNFNPKMKKGNVASPLFKNQHENHDLM